MHVAVTKAGNIALLFSEFDGHDGAYVFGRQSAEALVMTLLEAIDEADRIKEAED